MNAEEEVIAAIEGMGPIERGRLVNWMRNGDLRTRAAVYRLTEVAWERISPEPTMQEQCVFMASYLLECLRADPQDLGDCVLNGFEAAWGLASWLKHLAAKGAVPVIADVADRLADLYRKGDSSLRGRIETGTLEHTLESPALRPFFRNWQTDAILTEAYEHALEWARAHETQ